jgi:hypothetical protein
MELTSLHAACENGEPTLRWTTASEHGNSGFFIQRSIDGEQWKDIGWVNGAGNSTQALNYVFADREPLPQRLAFYRLRQVDMDGVEELSEIVYVKDCDGTGADIRLVPNPVEDIVTLYVDLGRDTQGPAEVEFIDAFGRSLQRRSMGLSPEQSSIVLDISSLPSGSYTVALRHIGTGRVLRSRMIKR